jgi:ArsR family transcriptional regulator, cadmium/lead-responsive transcriptional repressor
VVLERAGLLDGKGLGSGVHYRINVDRLDDATRLLSDLASTWDRRLLRIKRLAEAAHAEAR